MSEWHFFFQLSVAILKIIVWIVQNLLLPLSETLLVVKTSTFEIILCNKYRKTSIVLRKIYLQSQFSGYMERHRNFLQQKKNNSTELTLLIWKLFYFKWKTNCYIILYDSRVKSAENNLIKKFQYLKVSAKLIWPILGINCNRCKQ